MATIQFENGMKVEFDGTPTPADVEEVAKSLGLSKKEEKKWTLQNNPITNFGVGIGTEIGKTGLGAAEAVLKGAGSVTGSGFLKQAGAQAGMLSEEIYQKPFEEQLDTTSGKIGKFTGTVATFMAPNTQIAKGQRILQQVLGTSGKSGVAGFVARRAAQLLPEMLGTGAVELARTGGDTEAAKKAAITAGVVTGAFGTAGDVARATFWPELKTSVTRALGVTGKTTGGKIIPQIEKKVAGMGVLKEYAKGIKVKDIDGIEKPFVPNKATFHETLQAWNEARKQIYNQYHAIAKNVGDDVTIDLTDVGHSLSGIIDDTRTAAYKNGARQILKDLVDNFGEVKNGEVVFKKTNPIVLEKYLSDLYGEAGSFISGRSDKAYGDIAAATARQIRQHLDDAIEGASGTEYQVLRSKYGSLKSIEDDLVKRFQQEARRLGGGLNDYVNIFSSGDIIGGILFQQPQLVAKGAAQGIFGTLLKSLKRPDRYLQRAFRLSDNKVASDLSVRLFGGVNNTPLTDDEARLVQSLKDYVKNPKAGLSMVDVGKSPQNMAKSFVEQAQMQLNYHGNLQLSQKLSGLNTSKVKTFSDLEKQVFQLLGPNAKNADVMNWLKSYKQVFQQFAKPNNQAGFISNPFVSATDDFKSSIASEATRLSGARPKLGIRQEAQLLAKQLDRLNAQNLRGSKANLSLLDEAEKIRKALLSNAPKTTDIKKGSELLKLLGGG